MTNFTSEMSASLNDLWYPLFFEQYLTVKVEIFQSFLEPRKLAKLWFSGAFVKDHFFQKFYRRR